MMVERDFCYWLQGLFEVANPQTLDVRQTQMIKDHLALVMQKVTPMRIPAPVSPLTVPFKWPSPTVDNDSIYGPDRPRLIC